MLKAARNYFKGWNLFEIIFLGFSVISSIIIAVLVKGWWAECATGVTTIIWIMLLAKGKVEGYVVALLQRHYTRGFHLSTHITGN